MFSCLDTQIARLHTEQGKRGLFRGWSRLCLHAASLNAIEAGYAAATAAAKAARAEAEEKEAAAAIAAIEVANSKTAKRQQLAEDRLKRTRAKTAVSSVIGFAADHLRVLPHLTAGFHA